MRAIDHDPVKHAEWLKGRKRTRDRERQWELRRNPTPKASWIEQLKRRTRAVYKVARELVTLRGVCAVSRMDRDMRFAVVQGGDSIYDPPSSFSLAQRENDVAEYVTMPSTWIN
jgi:hypothetical protein